MMDPHGNDDDDKQTFLIQDMEKITLKSNDDSAASNSFSRTSDTHSSDLNLTARNATIHSTDLDSSVKGTAKQTSYSNLTSQIIDKKPNNLNPAVKGTAKESDDLDSCVKGTAKQSSYSNPASEIIDEEPKTLNPTAKESDDLNSAVKRTDEQPVELNPTVQETAKQSNHLNPMLRKTDKQLSDLNPTVQGASNQPDVFNPTFKGTVKQTNNLNPVIKGTDKQQNNLNTTVKTDKQPNDVSPIDKITFKRTSDSNSVDKINLKKQNCSNTTIKGTKEKINVLNSSATEDSEIPFFPHTFGPSGRIQLRLKPVSKGNVKPPYLNPIFKELFKQPNLNPTVKGTIKQPNNLSPIVKECAKESNNTNLTIKRTADQSNNLNPFMKKIKLSNNQNQASKSTTEYLEHEISPLKRDGFFEIFKDYKHNELYEECEKEDPFYTFINSSDTDIFKPSAYELCKSMDSQKSKYILLEMLKAHFYKICINQSIGITNSGDVGITSITKPSTSKLLKGIQSCEETTNSIVKNIFYGESSAKRTSISEPHPIRKEEILNKNKNTLGTNSVNKGISSVVSGGYSAEPFYWPCGINLYKYAVSKATSNTSPSTSNNLQITDYFQSYKRWKFEKNIPTDHPWLSWISDNYEYPEELSKCMKIEKPIEKEEIATTLSETPNPSSSSVSHKTDNLIASSSFCEQVSPKFISVENSETPVEMDGSNIISVENSETPVEMDVSNVDHVPSESPMETNTDS